jgi:hypothetical protein
VALLLSSTVTAAEVPGDGGPHLGEGSGAIDGPVGPRAGDGARHGVRWLGRVSEARLLGLGRAVLLCCCSSVSSSRAFFAVRKTKPTLRVSLTNSSQYDTVQVCFAKFTSPCNSYSIGQGCSCGTSLKCGGHLRSRWFADS